MKKFLLGSVGLAAMIAGPAVAADMPLKAPPPVAIFSWTGCYVGAYVGAGAGRTSTVDAIDAAVPAFQGLTWNNRINISGAIGGGEAGCNYQVGTWVFGVEIDGGAAAKSGQQNLIAPFNTAFIHQSNERWLATARVRLGYAADKWLLYVTGGGAWAGVEESAWNSVIPAISRMEMQTRNAWTVGVGAEYALGYGWSIKGEYLYMDFGTSRYFNPPLAGANVNSAIDVKLNQSVVKFGMNYKFDWGYGPVVAKY
jgi:outer membrane immunogenic protein